MQKVPVDKILIQPTVQFQWLKQHGNIEFSLPRTLLKQFECVWQLYCEQQPIKPIVFLAQTNLESFDLANNDLLFALFTGASYALNKERSFAINISDSQMIWHISH